jgi:hypothetical protein
VTVSGGALTAISCAAPVSPALAPPSATQLGLQPVFGLGAAAGLSNPALLKTPAQLGWATSAPPGVGYQPPNVYINTSAPISNVDFTGLVVFLDGNVSSQTFANDRFKTGDGHKIFLVSSLGRPASVSCSHCEFDESTVDTLFEAPVEVQGGGVLTCSYCSFYGAPLDHIAVFNGARFVGDHDFFGTFDLNGQGIHAESAHVGQPGDTGAFTCNACEWNLTGTSAGAITGVFDLENPASTLTISNSLIFDADAGGLAAKSFYMIQGQGHAAFTNTATEGGSSGYAAGVVTTGSSGDIDFDTLAAVKW